MDPDEMRREVQARMDELLYGAFHGDFVTKTSSAWETQRDSTTYFDKLWLSEIGIKP